MREIIYVNDPDDRVNMRCFDTPDGVIRCTRRKGHPNNTIVYKKIDEDEVKVEFNHRGQSNGKWVTW